MEGTRQDVIATILHWTTDFGAANIFWIKGHPGIGKSAISVSIVESLRKAKRLGSSFFFQRERANVLTPNALWCTVAYDLSRNYPTIQTRILATLAANEAVPTTLNVDNLFRELIHESLTTCDAIPVERLPVIIVDALDECGGLDGQHSEHRTNVMRTLKSWSRLPKRFKLLVTSRGETDIEQLFSTTKHQSLEVHAGVAVNSQSLEDIRKFLEDRCRQIVSRYQDELPADWPGPQGLQELTHKSGGLFIWAKIVISLLSRGQPQEQLRQILAGAGVAEMATLYSRILNMSFPHPSETTIRGVRAVVGAIILAQEPLPASSLSDLCSINPLTMRYIRNGLQSVMTPGDILRFKHHSFVDYMINPAHCLPVFLVDLNDQNRKLTLSCLQTMKKHLRFNICDLKSSHVRNSEIPGLDSKIEECIPLHISYSCRFWTSHLTGTIFDIEIFDCILDFMQHNFLYWLEVLSLIKRVNLGSSTMQKLIDWLQVRFLSSPTNDD